REPQRHRQRPRFGRAPRAGRRRRWGHGRRSGRSDRLAAAGRRPQPRAFGHGADAAAPRRVRDAVGAPDAGMIRLLLADDQALVRQALVALLSLEDDFEVVADVGRGDEVVVAALEHRPDVALLDIEMPGLDGLAAAGALTEQVPGCRVLMLTT